MKWVPAPDIKNRLNEILMVLAMPHIVASRLVVFRSYGSTSRARARIWALPQVWRLAFNVSPHYVIEVLSERFDKLSLSEQDRTLIHELMHIPKTFSGALVPHRGRNRRIDIWSVEVLYRKYRAKG